MKLHTESVPLNSILALVVWSLRLLWEVAWCAEDELVVNHGSLEVLRAARNVPAC